MLEWLYSLHRFGIKPGLERVSQILNYLDNPEKSLQTIHIAGTNGKGTTASTIASIYSSAGYKVGLYTSPHLIDFNERIQINGNLISDDYLIEVLKSLKSLQESTNATFFELTTALALKYFADNKVDLAVIEAGMGGKNDATNVVVPLLSIITSIGLEHQEYLGDTIELIATDKAGIIKPKCKVLVSDLNMELTKLFENIADENVAHLYFLDDLARINDIQISNFNSMIDFTAMSKNYVVHSPFMGKHQAWNIVCAATASMLLKDNFRISEKNIVDGISNVSRNFCFKGRFQVISQNPLTIIDVAHNKDSFEKLIEFTKELGLSNELNLCFAIMQDKDIPQIVNIIEHTFKKIVITKPKIERAAHPELIIKHFKQKDKVQIIENPNECVDLIINTKEPTIYTGSFYLIGEVLEAYQNHLHAHGILA